MEGFNTSINFFKRNISLEFSVSQDSWCSFNWICRFWLGKSVYQDFFLKPDDHETKLHCFVFYRQEAELIVFSIALYGSLRMKKHLLDFDVLPDQCVIFGDNWGCISIIRILGNNRKAKHTDLKVRFIHEQCKGGQVWVEYIERHNNQSDILTRGLKYTNFLKIRYNLGLTD